MANNLSPEQQKRAAALTSFIDAVGLGDPITVRNLLVLPIFGPKSGPAFTCLADALASGWAEVTEVSDSGDVNTLSVQNRGPSAILVFDGEELVGAKQNRIANTTVFVTPRSNTLIPVSCVERGRWRYTSRRFAAGSVLPSSMRRTKVKRVTANLRRTGAYDADQHQVWAEVDSYARRRAVRTPTGALADVTARDGATISAYVEATPCIDGQTGVAAFVNGELAALDILGNATAYAELHPRLIGAIAAEAVEADSLHGAPSDLDVRAALARVGGAPFTEATAPGSGLDLRFELDDHTVTALLVDDAVVHLAMFATPVRAAHS